MLRQLLCFTKSHISPLFAQANAALTKGGVIHEEKTAA
jgi:hypothetical protein